MTAQRSPTPDQLHDTACERLKRPRVTQAQRTRAVGNADDAGNADKAGRAVILSACIPCLSRLKPAPAIASGSATRTAWRGRSTWPTSPTPGSASRGGSGRSSSGYMSTTAAPSPGMATSRSARTRSTPSCSALRWLICSPALRRAWVGSWQDHAARIAVRRCRRRGATASSHSHPLPPPFPPHPSVIPAPSGNPYGGCPQRGLSS